MSEVHRSLLEKYRELPDRLERLVNDLEESDLDLSLETGWSIRQYICHLVEGEQLWQINLRVVIGLDGETFPFEWYFKLSSQDEWAERWAYDRRSLKVMLDQYRAGTHYLADILENLPPDIWEHYGRVTWPGTKEETRLTVSDIVKINLEHIDVHSEDIRAIRALHGR